MLSCFSAMNAVTVRLLFPSGCSGELELQFDSVTCKYNRGFVSGGGMKTKMDWRPTVCHEELEPISLPSPLIVHLIHLIIRDLLAPSLPPPCPFFRLVWLCGDLTSLPRSHSSARFADLIPHIFFFFKVYWVRVHVIKVLLEPKEKNLFSATRPLIT